MVPYRQASLYRRSTGLHPNLDAKSFFLTVLSGTALFTFWLYFRHHHARRQTTRGRYPTSESLADYTAWGPRCLVTPYPVCDGRVTVGAVGPEQGCTEVSGAPAPGKFLTASFHTGTSNEMAWLADELGIEMNIGGFCAKTYASPYNENNPYVFSNERVASIWKDQYLARRLESYAGVITTDTSMAIYPFLSNSRFDHKPLIIWITNRFDTTMSEKMSPGSMSGYEHAMKQAACCKQNVFFVAAHPAEIEYAKIKYPSINTTRWRVIYPTGHESSWLRKQLEREHGKTWVSRIQLKPASRPKQLCVYPGLNEAVMMEDFGDTLRLNLDMAENLGAPREARSYGGPRGLALRCKGIIHVPYSPQTMSLWENAQLENVFFLPTPRLLVKWAASENFKTMKGLFQMSDHVSLDRPLQEDFLNRTEWYREERWPLFIYFDSAEDLVHQFKTLDFENKRKQIREYMDRHAELQLDKWRELFKEVEDKFPDFHMPWSNKSRTNSTSGDQGIHDGNEAAKALQPVREFEKDRRRARRSNAEALMIRRAAS
mmetsp:Transcript_97008/g.171539  ORF Transcript_97008/g.171539 Transcript_97008/m.171539 type:complete len:543 (-) Transcript_97008:13-1641(-)